MFCHQIISTELLPAHWAAVGFLSCVDPRVHVQVAHMAELLSTNPAAVRLLLRVDPHVHGHTAAMPKPFTTHFTDEQFPTGVDLSVAEFFAASFWLFMWWSRGVWFTAFSHLVSPCMALREFTDTVACQCSQNQLRPHVGQSHRTIWQKSPTFAA